uniref:Zona-pellucida-binding protein 1/2 C-terminal domain-containing protein n=1 Tax=Gopherus agassizii TaxID=38772 RepID=A0A452GKF4_9SAUR
KHEFRNVPAIHYIDHSFEVTRIDSCRPGFGKNDDTHNDCASCCGNYRKINSTATSPADRIKPSPKKDSSIVGKSFTDESAV